MDQVSRPMLIALVATVLFAGVWVTALRPGATGSGGDAANAPSAPSAPAAAVQKAERAATATEQAAARSDAASNGADATSQAPAASAKETSPAPKAAARPRSAAPRRAGDEGPQARIARELDAGKVVVVLFWDRRGADDRAARDAVRDLSRRDGKVVVHVAPAAKVGDYSGITQGLRVAQTPTTVVISPKGTARTIVGLSEPTEVDQLVRDALAAR